MRDTLIAPPCLDADTTDGCPIRDILDRIGDQWTLLVLHSLDGGTLRFNELMRAIGDVSKQMLSTTLKRLDLVEWANRHHEAIRDARRQYRLPG